MKITNYQFPENKDGDWDSNWLNIYLSVDTKVGKWQTVDASLTTWEIEEIIDWLSRLSKNLTPTLPVLEFTEPNLSFELLNSPSSSIKKIRIHFKLESRPKTAKDETLYFVDFEFTNYDLEQLTHSLRKESELYPARKP